MNENRVLIVDDDANTLKILRMILEMDDIEVISTTDPFKALNMARYENPSLVLLDIMMPQMDGFTLCQKIREYPETMTLPIFFVTAYQAADLERKAQMAGANGVIEKPIQNSKILALLERHATP